MARHLHTVPVNYRANAAHFYTGTTAFVLTLMLLSGWASTLDDEPIRTPVQTTSTP